MEEKIEKESDSKERSKIKKDCFAYMRKGECGVLTELVCINKKCSFYKTQEDFEEGLISNDKHQK